MEISTKKKYRLSISHICWFEKQQYTHCRLYASILPKKIANNNTYIIMTIKHILSRQLIYHLFGNFCASDEVCGASDEVCGASAYYDYI